MNQTGLRKQARFLFYDLLYFKSSDILNMSFKSIKKKGVMMRGNIYSVRIDDEKIPILVKESSKNYPEVQRLSSMDAVADFLNAAFHAENLAEEHVWLLAVSPQMKLIGGFEISHGSSWQSVAPMREIFTRLCLCNASQFFLCHNHPSGEVKPSKGDIETTKKLADAAKLMDTQLIDHIIVGKENGVSQYFSFRAEGIGPFKR